MEKNYLSSTIYLLCMYKFVHICSVQKVYIYKTPVQFMLEKKLITPPSLSAMSVISLLRISFSLFLLLYRYKLYRWIYPLTAIGTNPSIAQAPSSMPPLPSILSLTKLLLTSLLTNPMPSSSWSYPQMVTFSSLWKNVFHIS